MTEARVSPLQERILCLRDSEDRSWGEISRVVSAEFGRQIKRNYCQVLHKRAKAALAGYANIAERQSEWERPTNAAKRYTRRQWKKFSPGRRKLEWRLSPYPPDPLVRAMNPPRRAPKKSGEELVAAKQKLIEHLRLQGDEESLIRARSLEKPLGSHDDVVPTPSESRSPATSVPTASQQVCEPITQPAPVPVPPAAPESPAKSERKIFVFDWRPIDRSGIFDADGDRVSVADASKHTLCEIRKIDTGHVVVVSGRQLVLSAKKNDWPKERTLALHVDSTTHRITATVAPEWRTPAANEVFDWSEAKRGERPIYRFADGKIAAWVEGSGQWKDKIFRAPDDAFVLTDCRAADELLLYTVFRDGEFWASKNGERFVLELERPAKASGLDYETATEYRLREIQEHYAPNLKHPRQSWLRVLRIAPASSSQILYLPVPWRANLSVRDLQMAQDTALANSRSRKIQERDAQRQQERQAQKPSLDLTDPATFDAIYLRGTGF